MLLNSRISKIGLLGILLVLLSLSLTTVLGDSGINDVQWDTSGSTQSFGPSTNGRGKSYMFFSDFGWYHTGEGWTWLNTNQSSVQICASVTSWTVNGANHGSAGETCKSTGTGGDIHKAVAGSYSGCTAGVTYTYAVGANHRILVPGGGTHAKTSSHSANVLCS